MIKKYTDEQRDLILAAARSFLENQGIDVDCLDQEALQQRAERRQFTTPLGEGVSSRFQNIPEGNTEHRAVGRYGGGKAPRCQAKSRRSGWQQCGNLAISGHRVCRVHGAKAHGKKSEEGIRRSAAHLLTSGCETRELRRKRSEASKELRQLNREMIAKGMATPEIRGPRPGKEGRIDIERYLKRRKHMELHAQSKAQPLLDKS